MEHNLVLAHKFSIRHRESVLASKRCYCFYCCDNFAPDEIMVWIDKQCNAQNSGQTALCPRCGIDAVIGDYDFPHIANADFLNRMHYHWFEVVEEECYLTSKQEQALKDEIIKLKQELKEANEERFRQRSLNISDQDFGRQF